MSTRKNIAFPNNPTHGASESGVVQNVNVWPFCTLAFEFEFDNFSTLAFGENMLNHTTDMWIQDSLDAS